MAGLKPFPILVGLIVLFWFARGTHAFGAGNIASVSKIEGQNWRHGDIEDTLLQILMARAVGGKKFDKMMVSRVYFGNWLRDYSQAIDVGTVKAVSAEAIRLLLSILGFMSFGYGSREFEVTADRLGCYRPEDHIDNPKGYADGLDARRYDPRLRGPIDEETELAVDPATGLKNYIANDNAGIMTSSIHVRRLFSKCVELGRSYQRSKDKPELYEALRLLGTGLHCLEDFLAHSNYCELALIEMGERDVFPHVGSRTTMRIEGVRHAVYPCVTGTFGGVDFLYSVTGEVSDKMAQSEIQELEGTLQNSQNGDTSVLRNLLDKIPSGIFGGDDKKQKMNDIQNNANSSQMQNMSVSPRSSEEFTQWISEVHSQVMPAIEFHDEILQNVSEFVDKIPVLPQLIEQLEEQLSVFVFSIIAPMVVPVIDQIKNELSTGSSEIVQSSKDQQFQVFNDDDCSDPTHSMLSKDHFSNILNEIAGQTAAKVVAWVVPQIMQAWDDHSIDVDGMLDGIVNGVLHHPAQRHAGDNGARECRDLMYRSVEQWWQSMDDGQRDEYRQKLSREGVQNGENNREGEHDTGHGCGKPLGVKKNFGGVGGGGGGDIQDQIAGAAAGAIMGGLTGGLSDLLQGGGRKGDGESTVSFGFSGGRNEEQEQSGGLGGLLGKVAGGIFGGGGGGSDREDTQTYHSSGRTPDAGYQQTATSYGQTATRYGQAEYTQTSYDDGRQQSQYSRYEQGEQRPQQTGYPGGGYGGGEYRRQEEVTYERREEYSAPSYGRREEYERREEYSAPSYGRRDEFEERREDYGRRRDEFEANRENFGYGEARERRSDEEDGGEGRRHHGGRHHGEHHGGHHHREERRENEEYGERREGGYDEYGERRRSRDEDRGGWGRY